MDLSAFKAYDVRGRWPDAVDEELARGLGFAFVQEFGARNVVIGHDARLSGPPLYAALTEGLQVAGADVTGIGLCGTEEIYFAAAFQGFDGGIMITGSHNPADENGFKLVRGGAVPVSGDSGLHRLRERIAAGQDMPKADSGRRVGTFRETDFRDAYVEHLLSFVRPDSLRPLTIVADAGNGCAGPVLERLMPRLPFKMHLLHGEPDGHFPNGVPNPLLPEKRALTARAVRDAGADFGVAWDGDFDRCFFYDAEGRFIEGYYLVGMLAEALLKNERGAKIVHDPRLVWNTQTVVRAAGGVPVESKTGHAFMKERMRAENALYGGEMSAHHYFRDFAYCDSGMLPWLLVAQLVSESGSTLARLVEERMAAFSCSGEINSRVADIEAVLRRVEEEYAARPGASVTRVDGLSVAFERWRFNLRGSNTEPVLRLNVESRGDEALLRSETEALLRLIRR